MSPMKLAPIGITAKLFAQAATSMDEFQSIQFDNNPIATDGIKSLHGYRFKNDDKETILILNISQNDFDQVALTPLISYTGQPTVTQYYSNTPYISPVYLGHNNIKKSPLTTINNSIHIPNFSVTVIEVEKEIVGLNNLKTNKIKLHPNPTSDRLHIETTDEIDLVSIWTFDGIKVFEQKKPSSMLNIQHLESGVYLIKIQTRNHFTAKTLFKY